MSAIEIFTRIANRFPENQPQITEFPSGAVMLDITICGERYCAEYLPSYKAYGLSKAAGATPFWEGVEQSFDCAEKLEAKVLEMMNANR